MQQYDFQLVKSILLDRGDNSIYGLLLGAISVFGATV
jgi:hypothetical protein